jgi:hypothetical protein
MAGAKRFHKSHEGKKIKRAFEAIKLIMPKSPSIVILKQVQDDENE